jgi:Xaa-Pro dipeptidase
MPHDTSSADRPQPTSQPELPFSTEKLDRYLDDAGIDVLLATSKHNVRYLLGGHHHHFFDYTDAIGASRYLPILVYPRGRPCDATYIANRNEKHSIEIRQREGRELWVPRVHAASSGTIDAMSLAIRHVRKLAGPPRRIGVEAAFLPWDVLEALS